MERCWSDQPIAQGSGASLPRGLQAHDPVQPGSTEGRPMDGAVSSPSRVARPESCGPRPLAKRLCNRVHIGVRDQWAAT